MRVTNGPWTYKLGDASNPYNGVVTAADDELIALRAVMNEEDAKVMRLIAAAPELLGVMNWWLAQMADDACDDMGKLLDEMSDKARAAIAKAKGV